MKAVLPLTCAGLLGLSRIGAMAQTAPGDPAGNETIPEQELSRPNVPPKGESQGGCGEVQQGRSLSDKLDAGSRATKPASGVDPNIVKPAPVPDPNSTPVIPPLACPVGRLVRNQNRLLLFFEAPAGSKMPLSRAIVSDETLLSDCTRRQGRSSRAIRLDVSHRAPPIFWISA
jgi:hypothetical protein